MTSQQSAAPATTAPATPASAGQAARPGPQPIISDQRGVAPHIAVYAFSAVPLLAVALAIPFAWGWGLGWTDVMIATAFYVVSGLGITVGFHRYFTHGSFNANRPLKIPLAAAGQMAVQGPVIIWVAHGWRSSGQDWSGSRSCTTSPGRSTRSAT